MSDVRAEIEAINEMLGKKMGPSDLVGVADDAVEHYDHNPYLSDPIKKTHISFTSEELVEMKGIAARCGVDDLARFILEELRKLPPAGV
jgi:hypothetical protein